MEDVAAWAGQLGEDGSPQYMGDLRRFMAFWPDHRTATEDDLTAYVLRLGGGSSRRRAVSALRSFYRFLLEDRRLEHNPASRLSRRVKQAETDQPLIEVVRRCCGDEQTAKLTWRDVTLNLVGHRQVGDCVSRLPDKERAILFAKAKERVSKGPVDLVAERCAEKVFEE